MDTLDTLVNITRQLKRIASTCIKMPDSPYKQGYKSALIEVADMIQRELKIEQLKMLNDKQEKECDHYTIDIGDEEHVHIVCTKCPKKFDPFNGEPR